MKKFLFLIVVFIRLHKRVTTGSIKSTYKIVIMSRHVVPSQSDSCFPAGVLEAGGGEGEEPCRGGTALSWVRAGPAGPLKPGAGAVCPCSALGAVPVHGPSPGTQPGLCGQDPLIKSNPGAADTQQAASGKQSCVGGGSGPQETSNPNRNHIHPPRSLGGRMGCPRREQATVLFQNSGQGADRGHGAWRIQVTSFPRSGAAWGKVTSDS